MKKKLMIIVPIIVLLAGGFAAKTFLLKAKAAPPPKLTGKLLQLTPEFLVNLSDGHYGKVTVAFQMTKLPAAAAGTSVVLPEDPAVRAIITDAITGLSSNDLILRAPRHALQRRILRSIKKTTDEPVINVLFTDIAVQ